MKEVLRNLNQVNKNHFAMYHGVTERQVRRVMQELSGDKNNPKIFIPTSQSGVYKDAEIADREEVRAYLNIQKAHIKTLYFDRILPLARFMTEREQEELYAHLDLFSDFGDQS